MLAPDRAEVGQERAEEIREKDEDSDDQLDVDAIAEQAVSAATKAVPLECSPISLDTSISIDRLYFPGKGKSGSQLRLSTGAAAGASTLRFEDFAAARDAPTPAAASQRREVRGAGVRPVNDEKLRRKEARLQRGEKLEKWFGLPKQKLTPELEKELKAIKLRANFDPKRFYKANDSKELPKHFVVATEVGGGMAPVGLHTSTLDGKKRGRSFLETLVHDEKVQEWTAKKTSEVVARQHASRFSGHGRPRQKGDGKRGTRRGGAWKKTRKGK